MVALGRAMLDDPHWGWHAAKRSAPRCAAAPISARRAEAVAGRPFRAPTRPSSMISLSPLRHAQNLAIDAERLWGEMMETAAIGGTPKGGICRLTLTDLDRQVRDWFKARCEALGCRVTVDDMGAMFARRDGQRRRAADRDGQPSRHPADRRQVRRRARRAGALEALRTLVEAGYETYAPIEVVNWTNEEGSRFAPAMVSSGVFAKVPSRATGRSRAQDRDGVTFGAALERSAIAAKSVRRASAVGVLRTAHRAGADPGGRGQDIGVVTGVQAMRWYEVTVTGQDAHTGATPMHCARMRCSAPRA
jgi:N-carbamoyl-L-amino-acid hydrolase